MDARPASIMPCADPQHPASRELCGPYYRSLTPDRHPVNRAVRTPAHVHRPVAWCESDSPSPVLS